MAVKLKKDQFTRGLAQRFKLVPFLEKALAESDFTWEYKYEPKRGDDAWHPSGHCTPTLNQLYHMALDTNPEPRTGPILKTFQVGHFWHQYIQYVVLNRLEFCSWKGIERRGQNGWGERFNRLHPHDESRFIPWKPFNWVTGAGDIAPCDIPGHGRYLVDIKTMSSIDFRRSYLPEWAADKYECQINIYMDFFSLEKALILGVCKDSPHDLKEIEYHRNQELIDVLYQKWQLVSLCLDEGVEPPAGEDIPLPLKGPV